MKYALIQRTCSTACLLGLLLALSQGLSHGDRGVVHAQQGGSRSADTELSIRHYRRGNTYNNQERYDEAIKEYELSVAADPEMLDSYRNMANIHYSQGRYDEAIPNFIRFVNLYDGAPDTALRSALANLGRLLRDRGEYDRAIEFDLRALEADRDNESLVYLTGNDYLNAGESDKALQVYEKAVELQPDNAFLHRTLGRIYDDQGELEVALRHYRKAAEIDPGSDFYQELVTTTQDRIEWEEQE